MFLSRLFVTWFTIGIFVRSKILIERRPDKIMVIVCRGLICGEKQLYSCNVYMYMGHLVVVSKSLPLTIKRKQNSGPVLVEC